MLVQSSFNIIIYECARYYEYKFATALLIHMLAFDIYKQISSFKYHANLLDDYSANKQISRAHTHILTHTHTHTHTHLHPHEKRSVCLKPPILHLSYRMLTIFAFPISVNFETTDRKRKPRKKSARKRERDGRKTRCFRFNVFPRTSPKARTTTKERVCVESFAFQIFRFVY